MSTRSVRDQGTPFRGTRSSSASVKDIYGGVNIGYRSKGARVLGIVGDDVQYEADRFCAGESPSRRGRANVPTSAIGVDGSRTQARKARDREGYGIDPLGLDIGTTDAESAKSDSILCGGHAFRVSRMDGPFVDRNVNSSSKGHRPRHLLKERSSIVWRE